VAEGPDAPPPAALYTGAEILTLESAQPRAQALATLGERILSVGSVADCREALRRAGASDFAHAELGGRCLLPGFIDTHLHPIPLLYFDMNADLRGVRSVAALQDALRKAADGLAPEQWLVGLQLEDADLAEERLPTRDELDAACPDRPVVVMEHDGHSAVGNGRALAAAGITAATPDPPGGRIERASDGSPLGPCRETAAQLLMGAVPTPSAERLREAAGPCFARLPACGITSAGVVLQTDEEGPAGSAGRLEAFGMALLLAQAPFATYAILIGKSVDAAVAARATPLHDPAAGRRVGGFKIFADGTFSSCTACMREPFADRPESRGYLTLGEDEIRERMRAADAAGLQICVHAIGDGAVERCVALYEELLSEAPRRDHRHRIEHASLVPPELVPRIARLGLCVSTQPLFIHSERSWLPRRLGAERARYAYPFRALLDAGIPVGGASDAPVESLEVLHAIQCCVTREGFETQQALSPAEALGLFTHQAARLQFEEAEKGTLAPGKRADLVVLSANPLRVEPERIRGIRVLRTVCGGRVAYGSDSWLG
jgi:predicted amidohydrolase YtcJ